MNHDEKMFLLLARETANASANELRAAKARMAGDEPKAKVFKALSLSESFRAKKLAMLLRSKVHGPDKDMEKAIQELEQAAVLVSGILEQDPESGLADQMHRVDKNRAGMAKRKPSPDDDPQVCPVCGFIAVKPTNRKCPVCGALPSKFVSTD